MMRRFLVIAYDFPPAGSAGVQRTLKFLRVLSDLGWQAVVIAPDAQVEGLKPVDPGLLDEIPATTRVIRVPGPAPRRNTPVRGRAERWLRLRSAFANWWCRSVQRAAVGVGPVELVYSTMPPFASADAGAETSRLLDVPWVADLRDAWALDELEGYLSRFHYYGELRHMERTLRRADAIVWNTEESLRRARLSLRGLPQRQLAIRNGYDPAEFAEASPPRTDGQFRIVHTGTFLTDHAVSLGRAAGLRRALGGAAPADARGRSPIYLMAALDLLLSRRPDLMGRIEVHLAGELSKEDHDATRAELVYTHGHLARSESLALIRSADLLFLPMHRLPAGMRSSSAPGKTYEYLGSGRPVLAAVPGGDVRDVIAAAGNGYVCDPDDVHAIASAIEQECDRWARGEPLRRPDPAVLAQHQRQAQAAILATVFEDVLRGTNAAREERRPDDARDRTKAQPSRSTRST